VARLQPDDYAGRYSLALALQRKGDDDAAVAEFQKAVALDPGDPNIHLALGVSLERVRRISDAVPQYQQYLAMQPNSADAARLKEHLTKLSGHP
jgi:Flp pilus assembly protein TadD